MRRMSSIKYTAGRPAWTQRYLAWPLEAAAFIVVLALLATLPRRLAAKVGGALTGAIGPVLSRQHARAMRRNLSVAFPGLPERDGLRLQREIWRHFGRVLSTYTHVTDQHATYGTKIIVAPETRSALCAG